MKKLEHTIEINCSVEQLFNYVTQPWLWHEWHPNSQSATHVKDYLEVGDQFEERIRLTPFKHLPITFNRHTLYNVITSDPNSLWIAEGAMNNGSLKIMYEFTSLGLNTVRFKRTVLFNATGIYSLLNTLLSSYLAETSVTALTNLRNKLESH